MRSCGIGSEFSLSLNAVEERDMHEKLVGTSFERLSRRSFMAQTLVFKTLGFSEFASFGTLSK